MAPGHCLFPLRLQTADAVNQPSVHIPLGRSLEEALSQPEGKCQIWFVWNIKMLHAAFFFAFAQTSQQYSIGSSVVGNLHAVCYTMQTPARFLKDLNNLFYTTSDT